MLVTRETEYAVRCVLYLARQEGRIANVGLIAEKMNIPKSFLAKILQRLVRESIVESSRGMNGGFRLLKKPENITLLEMLTIIQGVAPVNTCAIDKRRCELNAQCSVHPIWVEIRTEIERSLGVKTIADLAGLKHPSGPCN
jgi:Rrf2 family protein